MPTGYNILNNFDLHKSKPTRSCDEELIGMVIIKIIKKINIIVLFKLKKTNKIVICLMSMLFKNKENFFSQQLLSYNNDILTIILV